MTVWTARGTNSDKSFEQLIAAAARVPVHNPNMCESAGEGYGNLPSEC